MKPIYLTAEDYQIVKKVFDGCPYQVLIFGSRVKGTQQKFSDLDICLRWSDTIPLAIMGEYRERLYQSDLPFTAELIDYHTLSVGFRRLIDDSAVELDQLQPTLN